MFTKNVFWEDPIHDRRAGGPFREEEGGERKELRGPAMSSERERRLAALKRRRHGVKKEETEETPMMMMHEEEDYSGEDATERKLRSQTVLPEPPTSGGAGMGVYASGLLGVIAQTWIVTGFLLVWSDQYILLATIMAGSALVIKVTREVAMQGMKSCGCLDRPNHLVLYAFDMLFWTAIASTVIIMGLWAGALFTLSSPYAMVSIAMLIVAVFVLMMWISASLVV
jgi:hypothetical protein